MKPTILFLPGLNCTADLFEPQMDPLSATWHCLVGDNGTSNTMEDIVSLILKTAPKQFAVVGLSMGGYLALEIMRQAPERVNALVLLDTRATADTPEDAERRLKTIDLAKRKRFDELHNVFWPRLVHPSRQGDKVLEATVRKMMDDTGAERFIRQQTAIIARPDYRPVLSGIKIPVLVGVGNEDVITPPAMAQEIADAIKGAELTVFEQCGHLSTLECPELVTQVIDTFFRKQIGASA